MPIVLPPNEVFEREPQPFEKAVGGYYNSAFKEIKQDPSGRILAYSHNHILPRKGLVFLSAAQHNNIFKGLIMLVVNSVGSFRPSINWLERVLEQLNRLAERVYTSEVPVDGRTCDSCQQSLEGTISRTDFMKFEHYNACSQELWLFLTRFLNELGISLDVANGTGKLIATVIEYEGDVYRLRIEDIFTILDVEALAKHPRRELKRVFQVYNQREKFSGNADGHVNQKFNKVVFILSLALWIPKVKKAFLYAARQADWQKLRFDDIDFYWACQSPTYDFFGEDLQVRHERLKAFAQQLGVTIVFQ